MPPKDLPGFYFDPVKNRYFPIKGPVPGGPNKRVRPSSSKQPDDYVVWKGQIRKELMRKTAKATKLIQLRELHGGVIQLGRRRHGFDKACQDVQVSHPMVWMYQDTQYIAECALENLHMLTQTTEGEKAINVLSMGNRSGGISFHNIGKVGLDLDCETYMPVPVWPSNTENLRSNISPTRVCRSLGSSANLHGSISSIKKIGSFSLGSHDDFPSSQNALVSTLGCGETGGTVYVFNFSTSTYNQTRLKTVASFDCTLWTSVCNPCGTQAAVGTDKGAALVSLETCKSSWILRSKSDIFSQQFDNSGNVVLCGLRNGAVIPVDIREKPQICTKLSAAPPRHAVHAKKLGKHGIEFKGDSSRFNGIFMPSAVCSLATLMSDDNYFLGSSMDGSIKLFDRRLPWRAVQSYEGHVNSHTHLQLGVNPSETHFLSGGEDCYVRVWNIKTGKLLFEENVCSSIIRTVCWPQNGPVGSYKTQWFDGSACEIDQSWGVWLGSSEGVYYMHGT